MDLSANRKQERWDSDSSGIEKEEATDLEKRVRGMTTCGVAIRTDSW